ncbi:replicative DNA helicase [Ornithinimicrobium sp. LYQ92]|uniref:replicative DNA helicase n=1 Tax=Serinicoccus sp. LYQ92 TaxID=3378798 RepID=UPI003854F1D9
MSAQPIDPEHLPEHLPAQAVEAERAVLGSILVSTDALTDVAETLTPEHFYRPAHERIYAAALHLAETGIPADVLTVAEHLRTQGLLDRIGGTPYLHQLAANVITHTNAAWHAGIVRDAHTLRTIATTGRELAATDTNPTTADDALEAVDAARARLDALVTTRDVAPTHAQAIETALNSLTAPPGMPTPWSRLTHAIGGWKPGELYIVGARPSIGKTAVAGQILLDAAHRHAHPVMYSLEMPRTQLHLRLLSNIGSVDGGRMLRRELTADDWDKLNTAGDTLAALPMTIDDRSGMSLAQIRAHLRALRRTTPDVGPVVVDYLGLIAPPVGAPKNDRRVQVDAIARGLKLLARELDVPVIALAQINRASEQTADRAPQMHHLRESGEIEAAADTVLLLHRDLSGDADPSELRIGIPKSRHGAVTQLQLIFQGHYSRVTEPPRWGDHDPARHIEHTHRED